MVALIVIARTVMNSVSSGWSNARSPHSNTAPFIARTKAKVGEHSRGDEDSHGCVSEALSSVLVG